MILSRVETVSRHLPRLLRRLTSNRRRRRLTWNSQWTPSKSMTKIPRKEKSCRNPVMLRMMRQVHQLSHHLLFFVHQVISWLGQDRLDHLLF
ncbi:unnamed protein product [Calypogeia fissa]